MGVIHRDLKPANVLLTDTIGEPKITDFGLATTAGGHIGTQSGQILGTPSYMAPEQAAGQKKQISAATDVYALGGILYESLTGRIPFRGAHPLETMALVLHQEPVPPRLLDPRIETDLQTICLKCLEKDPKRRYASALELADDLGRYLAGEPIQARGVNLIDRLSRTLSRNYIDEYFYTWSNILFYFAEVSLLIEIGLTTLISAAFPGIRDRRTASISVLSHGAATLALSLATCLGARATTMVDLGRISPGLRVSRRCDPHSFGSG